MSKNIDDWRCTCGKLLGKVILKNGEEHCCIKKKDLFVDYSQPDRIINEKCVRCGVNSRFVSSETKVVNNPDTFRFTEWKCADCGFIMGKYFQRIDAVSIKRKDMFILILLDRNEVIINCTKCGMENRRLF